MKYENQTLQPRIYILDCDAEGETIKDDEFTPLYILEEIEENPVRNGIENLFSKSTLENASHLGIDKNTRKIKGDTPEEHEALEWTINRKTELCDFLCANAFQG